MLAGMNGPVRIPLISCGAHFRHRFRFASVKDSYQRLMSDRCKKHGFKVASCEQKFQPQHV
eukprot:gene9219-11295_t